MTASQIIAKAEQWLSRFVRLAVLIVAAWAVLQAFQIDQLRIGSASIPMPLPTGKVQDLAWIAGTVALAMFARRT